MIRSLCVIAAFPLACVVLAAPVPKPFRSGWDSPVDPDGDCKIRRNDAVLTIEMPGGDHDYDPRRAPANAPQLLRDLEGDFEMQVRVRIDCRPSAQSAAKNLISRVSAGFLIIPPDIFPNNSVLLEYRVEGQGKGANGCVADLVEAIRGHRGAGYKPRGWPFEGKPDYVYLRLERWGQILSHNISADGKLWVQAGGANFSRLPYKLKVGLVACSTSTEPSKVHFDRFKLTRGKKRDRWDFVSGWGDPVDPDKDCKIKRDKDTLTIDIPGSDHDYDPVRKRFNAPRLLTEFEGDFDLVVRVQIDYRPSAQSTVKGQPSFVSAGFLLIYPETSRSICDRMEFAVSQQGSRRDAYAVPPFLNKPRRIGPEPKGTEADSFAAMKTWLCELPKGNRIKQRKDNRIEWAHLRKDIRIERAKRIEWDHGMPESNGTSMWERGWENWPLSQKADSAYLRLEQRGEWIYFSISPDEKKWTPLAYQKSPPAKRKVGLAAYSTSTEPSKVRFDQLKLWRPKKKE